MKTQFKILFSATTFLLAGAMSAFGFQSNSTTTDAEEVPGDNFSLEGALELFKKSASPEEFERLLNSPDSKVNNLDLNNDGQIDYVRVTDKTENNIHDFILTDLVSDSESQDVAVIELQKKGDGSAVLQIVGDADIYGVETIIEPTQEVKVNAGTTTARGTVNVWAWPSVQYIYGPSYSVWASPWSWAYYPGWYRPWRPLLWSVYNPYWAPYRPYYSLAYRNRFGFGYAARLYRPYRSTSAFVYNRHYTQINNFRNSNRGYGNNRGYAQPSHYNRYDAEHRTRSDYSNHNGSWSGGNNGNNGNNGGRTSGTRQFQRNSSPSSPTSSTRSFNTTRTNTSFSRGSSASRMSSPSMHRASSMGGGYHGGGGGGYHGGGGGFHGGGGSHGGGGHHR